MRPILRVKNKTKQDIQWILNTLYMLVHAFVKFQFILKIKFYEIMLKLKKRKQSINFKRKHHSAAITLSSNSDFVC